MPLKNQFLTDLYINFHNPLASIFFIFVLKLEIPFRFLVCISIVISHRLNSHFQMQPRMLQIYFSSVIQKVTNSEIQNLIMLKQVQQQLVIIFSRLEKYMKNYQASFLFVFLNLTNTWPLWLLKKPKVSKKMIIILLTLLLPQKLTVSTFLTHSAMFIYKVIKM